MLEEIRQQPDALARTLAENLKAFEDLRRRLEPRPPRLIVLVARGTSDNAALFGRYLLEITTGIPVVHAAPSILTLYGRAIDFTGVLLVAISQSGESTDTNMVLEHARSRGAVTVGITNEPASRTATLAEHVFLVQAGKEQSVAATKTYTAQLLLLYLLAWSLGAPISTDLLARVPANVDSALSLEPEIAARSERYTFMEHAVSVGRGLNYSNAYELALKLMETCYVVAERFSAADLHHGPIAIVESSFPAFLFAPSGVTWPSMKETLEKLLQLKAETLIFTDGSNPDARSLTQNVICIPAHLGSPDLLPADIYTPIPYIVPAQLFAAHLARHKRIDPDQPRTISKITRTL